MNPFSPEFSTKERLVDIEGLQLRLTLIADFDALLDRLMAKGDDHEDVRDERIPYWADLWPSAVALGRYLVRSGLVRPGLTVTEIGCGLGLPGIVAGMLGAEVTLTDYLPEALDFARHNWERNVGRPARLARLDWRRPDPALAADLVLAADLAYEQRAFEPLPRALRTLCRPGGTILLSEPGRAMAREFLESLPWLGFEVEKTIVEGRFDELPYRVNVVKLN